MRLNITVARSMFGASWVVSLWSYSEKMGVWYGRAAYGDTLLEAVWKYLRRKTEPHRDHPRG